MAQAARAYSQAEPYIREVPRAPLRVLPGKAPQVEVQKALDPFKHTLFKIAIFSALFIGLVLCVRVAVVTQIVDNLIVSEQISQNIEDARAAGLQLEVQHSIAANPTHIQELAAEELGMAPAAQVGYLDVTSTE
jgi:cell division protein FtsL